MLCSIDRDPKRFTNILLGWTLREIGRDKSEMLGWHGGSYLLCCGCVQILQRWLQLLPDFFSTACRNVCKFKSQGYSIEETLGAVKL